ncbi:MAG TPA: glycosyltransferase family 1 protein, partial [Flavobacteriia bacterium]|nr:glycosyltransferase family 1 protein [Flavobacteriia bacterium]
TGIYPNSFALADFMIKEKLVSPNKVKVIANGSSNGINTDFFSPNHFSEKNKLELKQTLTINETDFVYIFIGRLVSDKGLNELVQAFKKLQKEHKNIRLLLVGNEEPDLDPLLPKTSKIIKDNPAIITTGWVEDVRLYLAISDVFVFPSYREGFPNVVMQAGAMGLPCVVTNINGCNEIIAHEYNGLIVPPKNKEQLEKTMLILQNDSVLRNKLAENARPNIVKKYQQKIVWQALLDEYNRILESQIT